MQSLTYVIAAPEEIISALLDDKLRNKWDLRVKSAVKEGDSCIKVTYSADELYVETIKYNIVQEGNSIII